MELKLSRLKLLLTPMKGTSLKSEGKIGLSNPNYWWANQFDNPDNYLSHYLSTAPEMYEQMEGKIDAVVVASGSGGTAAGVSRYMKEKNPKIQVIVSGIRLDQES